MIISLNNDTYVAALQKAAGMSQSMC